MAITFNNCMIQSTRYYSIGSDGFIQEDREGNPGSVSQKFPSWQK